MDLTITLSYRQKNIGKDSLTETQIEKIEQDLKKIDKKFIPLSDISAENLVIDEALKIIGIGIIEDQKIVYDFYP